MTYRFKIMSEESDSFRRDIEINPDDSFLTLRDAILSCVSFSKDEINTFFICDDDWKRINEVAMEDFGTSSDKDLWLMSDTSIAELIEDEGQKLEFIFDGFTERSFIMELKEIITGKNLKQPVCVCSEGKAPLQHVDMDEFEKNLAQKAADISRQLDIDFYGDSEFNEDELGEGFDDLKF